MNSTTKFVAVIPQRFYDDHANRAENPKEWIDAITSSTKTKYTIELNRMQWNDLFSDASFYSEVCDYAEYKGLQKSAQATYNAMWKAME